jgi:flagellar hook-associated protein 2
MALTSAGIGSGLDVNGLVSQLMTVERAPVAALDKKVASYQAKLSTYGTLKGSLSALQTAAKALSTPDRLTPTKATVADSTLFSTSVNGTAVAGTYDVEVQSLAQSNKIKTTAGYAATTDVVGTGVITFDFGTYDTTAARTFSANAAKPTKTVTIDSTNNTLAGVRDAINAANIGVSASIINDGSTNGNYLSLTSNDTGARNAMKISVSDSSLNALRFNRQTDQAANSSMAQIGEAKDAVIIVDSVTITKQSNTITDAIQGVTLSLAKTMPLGTTNRITVSRDTSSVQTAVQNFVKAYNDSAQAIKDATAFNNTTGKGAVLNGDSVVRNIVSQLRGVFTTPVAGAPAGLSVLSDAGVSFLKDGTLSIDSAKLSAVTSDPSKDLSKLFASTASGKGYGYQMDVLLGKILSPVGTLAGQTNSINKSITDVGKQKDQINERLVGVEKRYRTQFSALDSLVGRLSSTSSYLTQQLASLSNNS